MPPRTRRSNKPLGLLLGMEKHISEDPIMAVKTNQLTSKQGRDTVRTQGTEKISGMRMLTVSLEKVVATTHKDHTYMNVGERNFCEVLRALYGKNSDDNPYDFPEGWDKPGFRLENDLNEKGIMIKLDYIAKDYCWNPSGYNPWPENFFRVTLARLYWLLDLDKVPSRLNNLNHNSEGLGLPIGIILPLTSNDFQMVMKAWGKLGMFYTLQFLSKGQLAEKDFLTVATNRIDSRIMEHVLEKAPNQGDIYSGLDENAINQNVSDDRQRREWLAILKKIDNPTEMQAIMLVAKPKKEVTTGSQMQLQARKRRANPREAARKFKRSKRNSDTTVNAIATVPESPSAPTESPSERENSSLIVIPSPESPHQVESPDHYSAMLVSDSSSQSSEPAVSTTSTYTMSSDILVAAPSQRNAAYDTPTFAVGSIPVARHEITPQQEHARSNEGCATTEPHSTVQGRQISTIFSDCSFNGDN